MTENTTHAVGGDGLDPQDLNLMLEALDDFVAGALDDDLQLELDHEDKCPEDIVRQMSDPEVLGVQLAFMPEPYGGMGGGAFDAYRICEVMANHDLGLATAAFATFLGSDPIMVGGTEEQKQDWLGRICEEGVIFAYGATEPEAGSDLGALTTTATPVKDDDGNITAYILNGRKQWISSGGFADLLTILANTEAGPSWFVMPKDAKGFEAAPPEDKHGIRLSNTAALFLEDVEVPAYNLIGGVEGKGLVQAQQVFGYTRLMVAAFGLGTGWAALDRAIEYSKNREQGGGLLCDKQGYTHKLIVPNAVRLEAARSYMEFTADRIDSGFGANGAMNTEGAISKYMATEAGNKACEDAIQAHGGYGYTRPYKVEKMKRDVRITTIYEGTSEIMEMTIARDRWQQHLKTRGQYYIARAAELQQLHARHPDVGADVAALAAQALAAVMTACQVGRLTRNQHVLFRLGELIAWVESAEVFAKRAAAALDGTSLEKTPKRFNGSQLACMARVFAREAAQKVAGDGSRYVAGAHDEPVAVDLPLAAITAAQAGLISDMDHVADILYDRHQD